MRLNTSLLRAVSCLTVLTLASCGADDASDDSALAEESAASGNGEDAASPTTKDPSSKPADLGKDAGAAAGEPGAVRPDAGGSAGRPGSTRDGGRGGTGSSGSGGGSSDGGGRPADASTPTSGRSDAATASGGGAVLADIESLRQLCVDEVNMYRATLNLAPLARAADQEACSDEGAKLDGDTGKAHGSAGKCRGLGGQNTCPGWGVGGRSGNATVADALKKCLKMMWDEAEPPVSRMECQNDRQGCFLKHGHYLNMTETRYKKIACGFYQMADGKYWMNQNFGS